MKQREVLREPKKVSNAAAGFNMDCYENLAFLG
jgi:hypothetical protein